MTSDAVGSPELCEHLPMGSSSFQSSQRWSWRGARGWGLTHPSPELLLISFFPNLPWASDLQGAVTQGAHCEGHDRVGLSSSKVGHRSQQAVVPHPWQGAATRAAWLSPPSSFSSSQGSPTGPMTSCLCSCTCWRAATSQRCFWTWST
jgi:hypothetical protein